MADDFDFAESAKEQLVRMLRGAKDVGRGVARGAASLPADMAYLTNAVLPLPGRSARMEASERMGEKAKSYVTELLGKPESELLQTGGEFAGPPVKSAAKTAMAVKELVPLLGGVMTYHGTPYTFKKYDLSKMGTGSKGQDFGEGAYLAEHIDTGRTYRPPQGGNLYAQDLPDEVLPKMLQWDKPLAEQPKHVQEVLNQNLEERLKSAAETYRQRGLPESQVQHILSELRADHATKTGKDFYDDLGQLPGIPGLSYLDAGSREAGKGTKNHVIWDQELLDRLKPTPYE